MKQIHKSCTLFQDEFLNPFYLVVILRIHQLTDQLIYSLGNSGFNFLFIIPYNWKNPERARSISLANLPGCIYSLSVQIS